MLGRKTKPVGSERRQRQRPSRATPVFPAAEGASLSRMPGLFLRLVAIGTMIRVLCDAASAR